MSLTLPHPRAPVTTGMDALLICELILHRLGLLRFPHLCLDLCTGPHVHSVPSCPFHCFQSHCCLPQLSPQQGRRITPGCFQQRCWEAEAVAKAGRSQGCWQRPTRGLLRESPGQQTLTSLTAEIWRGTFSASEAVELRRQVLKPQSPSLDAQRFLPRTHSWVIAGVWWITKLDLIPVTPALVAMKSLPKTMS